MNGRQLARAHCGKLTGESADILVAEAWGSIGPSRQSHLNSLGVTLMAMKYSRRLDFYPQATTQLASALKWRRVKDRLRVAQQAVQELLHDACATCGGSCTFIDGQGVVSDCAGCAGTGKRRYSDQERGVSARSMGEAHSLMALGIAIATRLAQERLG